MLQVEKPYFIGNNIYFVPQLAMTTRNGQQLIDLGMISITHLGPLTCPSAVAREQPIVIYTDFMKDNFETHKRVKLAVLSHQYHY